MAATLSAAARRKSPSYHDQYAAGREDYPRLTEPQIQSSRSQAHSGVREHAPNTIKNNRRRWRKIDPEARHAIDALLRLVTPSEALYDQLLVELTNGRVKYFAALPAKDRHAGRPEPMLLELERRGVFPPPAENTPMRPCTHDDCGGGVKLYPGHYLHPVKLKRGKNVIRACWCSDCREADFYDGRQKFAAEHDRKPDRMPEPATPDAMGPREVAERGMVVPEMKLLPESRKAMKKVIERYYKENGYTKTGAVRVRLPVSLKIGFSYENAES